MATDSAPRKLVKSEITTIRLDPKLKYMAELAARKQRRTLSSYIEWAVDQSLSTVVLVESEDYNERLTVADMTDQLWDVDESERFIKLAIRLPELLTHEEQELWKMLLDSGLLHAARFRDRSGRIQWRNAVLEDRLFPLIRSLWPDVKRVFAQDAAARHAWVKDTRAVTKPEEPDEIPF